MDLEEFEYTSAASLNGLIRNNVVVCVFWLFAKD